VPQPVSAPEPLTEKDLGHWNLLRTFRQHLDAVFERHPLPPTWEDPRRELSAPDYLSLHLFGLLNPVTQTVRGLCAASHLERVQREVCGHIVPRATFSDAQHVLDPALLEKVFVELSALLPPAAADPRLGAWSWLARDGSLFAALPRMSWALYGGGKNSAKNNAVRLHLSFHVHEDKPVAAAVRPGRVCERAVWEEQLEKGAAYIADRYFGENYSLFGRLEDKGCAYVIRLRQAAVIHVEEELPVSEADRAAGVTRQAWARLGARTRSVRLRVVWVQGPEEPLLLVTNLDAGALPGELVSQLYRQRWRIELFFRWIKCILGCGHWLAESRRGVAIQIYLALIASLLLQLYTGRRPHKRMMELIRFYLLGWASGTELEAGLQRYKEETAKKS
jgi:hypothetical protein